MISKSIEDTMEHKRNVASLMSKVIEELISRAIEHDDSKMQNPELDIFAEYGPKLQKLIYGSEEYNQSLKEMKPALDHHYHNNIHHPEFHKNGILGMNLIDLIEMICDWKAATLRHSNGDIKKSISMNKKRFDYSDELEKILLNTVKWINKEV